MHRPYELYASRKIIVVYYYIIAKKNNIPALRPYDVAAAGDQ